MIMIIIIIIYKGAYTYNSVYIYIYTHTYIYKPRQRAHGGPLPGQRLGAGPGLQGILKYYIIIIIRVLV